MNTKKSEIVASASEIGQNIKSIRGLQKLTQKRLCQHLTEKGIKCTNTTICNYERGCRLPPIHVISAIAEVCHCDIGDIVGRRPIPMKDKLTNKDVEALERTLKFVKELVRSDK